VEEKTFYNCSIYHCSYYATTEMTKLTRHFMGNWFHACKYKNLFWQNYFMPRLFCCGLRCGKIRNGPSGWSKWPDHTSRLSPGQICDLRAFSPETVYKCWSGHLGHPRGRFSVYHIPQVVKKVVPFGESCPGTHTGYRIFLSHGDFASRSSQLDFSAVYSSLFC
jgi:hypothetical protein